MVDHSIYERDLATNEPLKLADMVYNKVSVLSKKAAREKQSNRKF